MSVSGDYLLRCSVETGFPAATLERVARLGELAGDVARHPALGEALALKGGTPLNLGFGPPQRLSVDLDYNYVAHVERERMLADRPRVEDAFARLAERQGYRVQRSADAFAGRKLHLHFRSALGPAGLVQVDVNYLHRLPLDKPVALTLWQPGGLDRPSVRVVSARELLVGKLLALLDRGSPRDAWDVAALPAPLRELLGQPRLRQLFLALAATLDQPLPRYTHERLTATLSNRAVHEQLAPMLTAGLRPDAQDLAARAWRAVAPLVHLSPAEAAYFATIDRGDLRLGLLFPNEPAEAARLFAHPALQWKLANLSKRPQGRGGPRDA
jgi:hypothetical protein